MTYNNPWSMNVLGPLLIATILKHQQMIKDFLLSYSLKHPELA